MTPHNDSPREGALASIDADPFHLPERRRAPLLARALGHAGLIVLSLALWGRLTSEVWRADASDRAALERSPVAVEDDAHGPP